MYLLILLVLSQIFLEYKTESLYNSVAFREVTYLESILFEKLPSVLAFFQTSGFPLLM